MLVATCNEMSFNVEAWKATKSATYSCPSCGEGVILKQGRRVAHHFAHRSDGGCPWVAGETYEHLRCKKTIYDLLKSHPGRVGECHLEYLYSDKKARPDILVNIDGRWVAIEVQRSNLSREEIERRTANYHQKGHHVLWLGLNPEKFRGDRYSPKQWERFLHAVYFGRIYVWKEGLDILPVHLGPYMLEVPEREWYSESGAYHFGGGYLRYSRRYKTPLPGKAVSLLDMRPTVRSAAQLGEHYIPPAHICSDNQQRWWEK